MENYTVKPVKMIDLDVYAPNPVVEKFLQSLKVRLNKDYPTTTVYISTASQDNYWLRELYNKFNNTELME